MSEKRSIANPLIAVTFLLVIVATCGAQPSFRWTKPQEEDWAGVEDSVASGIRNLEHIRREIVESSLKGQDRRGVPSTRGQSRDSGHSTRSPGADGSEEKHSLAGGPAKDVRHPRRQVDSAMYRALAKLANVQIAQPGIRDATRSDDYSQDGSEGRGNLRPKSRDSESSGIFPDSGYANLGLPRTLRNEGTTEKTSTESSKLRFVPRKFHCHPIREIYIPKVEKKMPAYACSLGKRAFVISSERFVEDSRVQFDVNVDESTFRRLTPMSSGITTLTSGVSVLPATLVLKQGEDGYTVRGVNANWKDVQAAAAGDN